ncbi:hypothetical protein D3C76_1504890 [compost metagenome]
MLLGISVEVVPELRCKDIFTVNVLIQKITKRGSCRWLVLGYVLKSEAVMDIKITTKTD